MKEFRKKSLIFEKSASKNPYARGEPRKANEKLIFKATFFLVCVWVGVREKMLMGFY